MQLEKEGMDIELHYSDILSLVGQMMGLPEKEISNQFVSVYNSFMAEAGNFEITGTGNHLQVLAGKCYRTLKNCIEIEKRTHN